jgi:hypothetical protein
MGKWRYICIVFYLGIKMKVSGQHHVPTSLTWYKLEKSLGGPQSQSEQLWSKENLLSMLVIEPRPSSLKSVAIPTEILCEFNWHTLCWNKYFQP